LPNGAIPCNKKFNPKPHSDQICDQHIKFIQNTCWKLRYLSNIKVFIFSTFSLPYCGTTKSRFNRLLNRRLKPLRHFVAMSFQIKPYSIKCMKHHFLIALRTV
jgi:hypothetical protein